MASAGWLANIVNTLKTDTARQAPPDFTTVYTDPAGGFAFNYLPALKIHSSREGSATMLIARNAERTIGFQLNIWPICGSDLRITPERLARDMPKVVTRNHEMRRRGFVALLSAAALSRSPAGRAQQKAMPVIGILDAWGTDPNLLSGVRKGLAEAGYIDGQNVILQHGDADGHYDRFPALATELVRAGVHIIVAPNLPAALAAKAATTIIPIVFMFGDDPVRQGFVASLNKPGGNATGLSMLGAGLDAKRLQLLREMVPDVERIGLLVNPDNRNTETQIHDVQTAGSAMTRDIEVFRARNDQELKVVFSGFAQSHVKVLLVGADPFFKSRRQRIVDLARAHQMPAIYEWREFADVGGLVSYGSSVTDNYRQLGVYVGKILSGAKPADLPVMQPTKFELVINLKTAKELGITVPQSLLAQADEVIE